MGDKGMSHNPLSVLRPSMMILLFFRILTWNLEKIAMQSSSQSWPREISDPVWISSKITTDWAWAVSSSDSFIFALNLGEIISPLATVTWGVVVGTTLEHAGNAVCCKQCSVAAESNKATGLIGVDTTEIDDKSGVSILFIIISVPHRQRQFVVHPPCMFAKVAVVTWLGPGVLHSLPLCAQFPCV